MELAFHIEVILIAVALIAGFVDAIAGGGGLVVVPALLLAGLSPAQVLGTNKMQGLFGSSAATLAYARRGLVNLRSQWLGALLCALGGYVGARVVVLLPREFLGIAVPAILILIAIYFALRRDLTDEDRHARLTPILFAAIIAPFIGFYDGIFGPGAGTFYMLGFVSISGLGLTRAAAHTKLLNFASNLGGFIAFASLGVVFYKLAFMMGIGQFIGATLGARFAIRGGAKLIRPVVVVISILLAVRVLLS